MNEECKISKMRFVPKHHRPHTHESQNLLFKNETLNRGRNDGFIEFTLNYGKSKPKLFCVEVFNGLLINTLMVRDSTNWIVAEMEDQIKFQQLNGYELAEIEFESAKDTFNNPKSDDADSTLLEGEWIVLALDALGLSKGKLATELGVTRQTVINWQNGGYPHWVMHAAIGLLVKDNKLEAVDKLLELKKEWNLR
ncbi:TPA: helix-turn-helix transcriptional regulator [Vibrio parahaemolyticus]|nr:helix-turn-helix transcriptional regulator [Vibrio parahaemolyticus]